MRDLENGLFGGFVALAFIAVLFGVYCDTGLCLRQKKKSDHESFLKHHVLATPGEDEMMETDEEEVSSDDSIEIIDEVLDDSIKASMA